MSTLDFYNWPDGEFAIGTVTTQIAAYSRMRGDRSVALVGRVKPDVVEVVRRGLVDAVAALSPESPNEVESLARLMVRVDAYSAPRADGSRVSKPAWEDLPVDASDDEVRAASKAASEIAAAKVKAVVLRRERWAAYARS